MGDASFPSGPHDYASDGDELERLEAAMDAAPAGAIAVSAIAVGLLLAAWFLIYLAVFLPRGTVG